MSEQSGGPGWWLASDGKWYPPQSAQPIPPSPLSGRQVTVPDRSRVEWAALVGAAALVIGSFMTWATAGPFRVLGTDGDGWFTILLGGVAGWLAWQRRYRPAAVAAGLGVMLVIWKLSDLSSLADDSEIFSVSPGSGLYVCLVGGAVCAWQSLKAWSDGRSR